MNNSGIQPPETSNLALSAMQARREEILIALTQTHRKPSRGVLEELAELSIALDDFTEVNHVEYDPHQS